jgi:hypothetical protein
MRRLWAASAAIVVCLALGGIPPVVQEASEGPAVSPATAAIVQLIMECAQTSGSTRTTEGNVQYASGDLTYEVTADDGRVTGVQTVQAECYYGPGWVLPAGGPGRASGPAAPGWGSMSAPNRAVAHRARCLSQRGPPPTMA